MHQIQSYVPTLLFKATLLIQIRKANSNWSSSSFQFQSPWENKQGWRRCVCSRGRETWLTWNWPTPPPSIRSKTTFPSSLFSRFSCSVSAKIWRKVLLSSHRAIGFLACKLSKQSVAGMQIPHFSLLSLVMRLPSSCNPQNKERKVRTNSVSYFLASLRIRSLYSRDFLHVERHTPLFHTHWWIHHIWDP